MSYLAILTFSGSFAAATYVIASTVGPNVSRIADALAGRPQHGFEPLGQLVRAERRIAVRRWALSAPPSSARAAA